MAAAQLTAANFEDLWSALDILAVKSSMPKALLLPAHFLEGRTHAQAESSWKIIQQYDLHSHIRTIHDLSGAARKLERSISKYAPEIGRLFPCNSPFAEDEGFAVFLKEAGDMVEGRTFQDCMATWGSMTNAFGKPADFGLLNEYPMTSRAGHVPIYRHINYKALISVGLLENIQSNQRIPDAVRGFIDHLLEPPKRLSDKASAARHEAEMRTWIGLYAGLVSFADSEYQRLFEKLHELVADQELINTPYNNAGYADSFDRAFEAFIMGEIGVFMGGANHARLLERWWTRLGSRRIVPLLDSTHLSTLLGEEWPPYNRLVFGTRLSEPTAKPVRTNVRNLYREIAILLYRIGAGARTGQVEALCLMRHLMASIAEKGRGHRHGRWGFVTDEEDMVGLLLEDNDFRGALPRGRSRSGRSSNKRTRATKPVTKKSDLRLVSDHGRGGAAGDRHGKG
jgi:hypothetical protein